MRTLLALSALGLLLAMPAGAQAAPTVLGGIDCVPSDGVRFCQGGLTTRVPTFDGAALIDANVTLPATGSGPFPLVIIGHGWGGAKEGLSASGLWATLGYAVLYASARGFGDSCGSAASRQAAPAACAQGYSHIDDTRYEVRDVQELAGRLVDEGIAEPTKIAATGCSYGGSLALALGLLRDRVMLPDGSYAPWRSPAGTQLRIAAAAPCSPWSDLVAALVPNGRDLDYTVPAARGSREPFGVAKLPALQQLVEAGHIFGYLAPAGTDPGADLVTWSAWLSAGEPYGANAALGSFHDELVAHHSALGIARDGPPAPMMIQSGWADDLFPAGEAVRMYNVLRTQFGSQRLALLLSDTGHPRAQNKRADQGNAFFRRLAWIDYYVRGAGAEPTAGVTAYTQTCPASAPSQGPFSAPSWAALRPGEIRSSFAFPAAFGNPATAGSSGALEDLLTWIAALLQPGAGRGTASPGTACGPAPAADQSNTATYRMPAAGPAGYTLMGSPTVISVQVVTGSAAQVTGRLWDVGPNGLQTLVARGAYRPEASGLHVFQLNPVGYRFEPGHVAKLELSGGDPAYARLSNGPFVVQPLFAEVRLPVLEAPGGANGMARPPAPPVVPLGALPAAR